MSYDSLLEDEVGGVGCGRWQARVTALLWAGAFYTGMAFLLYPFAFATPRRFRCAVPGCDADADGDGNSGRVDQPWVDGAIPKDGAGGSDERCVVLLYRYSGPLLYCMHTYPTNIGTATATPMATPLVAISDGVEICVALGFIFFTILTSALALEQPITKCTLTILVGIRLNPVYC